MNQSILNRIQLPEDLRRLSLAEMEQLSVELRQFIIDIVAIKEGHLGASLGVIELTIALHYVFNTPDDIEITIIIKLNQITSSKVTFVI